MHRICESCFSHNLNSTKIFHFHSCVFFRPAGALFNPILSCKWGRASKKDEAYGAKNGLFAWVGSYQDNLHNDMLSKVLSALLSRRRSEANLFRLLPWLYSQCLKLATKSRILVLFCLQNGASFGVGWGANFGKSKQTQNGANIRISSLGSQFCK